MSANLTGHPASDDAVDRTSDLAMQAGVQLESLAQAHLFGQRHHQVAVITFGQLLSQCIWLKTIYQGYTVGAEFQLQAGTLEMVVNLAYLDRSPGFELAEVRWREAAQGRHGSQENQPGLSLNAKSKKSSRPGLSTGGKPTSIRPSCADCRPCFSTLTTGSKWTA